MGDVTRSDLPRPSRSVVGWGIVGTGFVADQFADDFAHVEDAEIVAVHARKKAKALMFAEKYRVNKAYDCYEDILADEAVDIVYIAIPNHLHAEYCKKAFEAGKAVLCEKPLALNAEDARAIFDEAKKHKVFCMEAMWMLCMPMLAMIEDLVARNEIGKIRHIEAHFGYPSKFDADNRLFDIGQGGGALLDCGIYTLALAFHFLGSPTKVSATASICPTGVDERSSYKLEFDQGVSANLSSSFVEFATNSAILIGTSGWIHIHPPFYRPEFISVHSGHPPDHLIKTAKRSSSRAYGIRQKALNLRRKLVLGLFGNHCKTMKNLGHGYEHEIREASRCLSEGLMESPMVPHRDSLAILEIMDSLREQFGLKYPNEN